MRIKKKKIKVTGGEDYIYKNTQLKKLVRKTKSRKEFHQTGHLNLGIGQILFPPERKN